VDQAAVWVKAVQRINEGIIPEQPVNQAIAHINQIPAE
jgi:hypothetical protein